jgi:hypothetical protein
VATQAFLYFSSSMGTLTEVDVVTSASYSTEFHAENLGTSSSAIAGTTSGNLSINVPTGAIAVAIPPVTENFSAAPFDGNLDFGGPSGKDFAPVTSGSAARTTVLTSPVDLAAFTGNFRMPVSVSGHATGSVTSSNGDLSAGFHTQTSATITIIYHYIPALPSLDPPVNPSPSPQPPSGSGPGGAAGSSGSPTLSGSSQANAAPPAPDGTTGLVNGLSTQSHQSSIHGRKKKPVRAAVPFHKGAHHSVGGLPRLKSVSHSRGVKIH